MDFRTQITINPVEQQLDYNSRVLLFGSCFSNNIGDKLSYFKFNTQINPFGIIFQHKAIVKLLLNCMENKVYTEKDLVFYNERWHCFDVHSDLSDSNKDVLLENLNSISKKTKEQLLSASHLIITLGTAWAYRHINTDELVANCHKIPQKQFTKELLSATEISDDLELLAKKIRRANKNCMLIFTLSPVRHLKDGFIDNQKSKAHLLTAIHHVVDIHSNSEYFPAYEIMLDDLRDYRFYKPDMIHPNQTAIDYIWELFVNAWVSASANEVMLKVQDIQNGLHHKPFNPNSEAHQEFLKVLEIKKQILFKEYGIVF